MHACVQYVIIHTVSIQMEHCVSNQRGVPTSDLLKDKKCFHLEFFCVIDMKYPNYEILV